MEDDSTTICATQWNGCFLINRLKYGFTELWLHSLTFVLWMEVSGIGVWICKKRRIRLRFSIWIRVYIRQTQRIMHAGILIFIIYRQGCNIAEVDERLGWGWKSQWTGPIMVELSAVVVTLLDFLQSPLWCFWNRKLRITQIFSVGTSFLSITTCITFHPTVLYY